MVISGDRLALMPSDLPVLTTGVRSDLLDTLQKGMFRQSKTPRKSVSAPEYPITLQESGESSYLFTPNIVRHSGLECIMAMKS